MLCNELEEMAQKSELSMGDLEPVQAETAEKGRAPKVYLSDCCADLNKRPTLEQAEKALAAVAIEDREQLKRAKDMRTRTSIISQKS